jgi:cytidylate kinase
VPVITVSRQFGSGGSAVAQRVADRLDWTLVDNAFIDRVAERVELPAEEVARREERLPGLIERLATSLSASSPEIFLGVSEPTGEFSIPDRDLVQVTQAVITEAVQHDNVVLVGRGAQSHLSARRDVLHVFVVAPRETRVQRVAERLSLSFKDADKAVAERDNGRRRYVDTHYGRVWDDPANYHLVINCGILSFDEGAHLVIEAATDRGWLDG